VANAGHDGVSDLGTPNRGSSQGNVILAPVPVKSGDPLCLYNAGNVASADWQVVNLMGERVTELSFGGSGSQCWNTTGTAPGIYIVLVKVTYLDGTTSNLTQKVVVVAP
jgi:hypothetical protein